MSPLNPLSVAPCLVRDVGREPEREVVEQREGAWALALESLSADIDLNVLGDSCSRMGI